MELVDRFIWVFGCSSRPRRRSPYIWVMTRELLRARYPQLSASFVALANLSRKERSAGSIYCRQPPKYLQKTETGYTFKYLLTLSPSHQKAPTSIAIQVLSSSAPPSHQCCKLHLCPWSYSPQVFCHGLLVGLLRICIKCQWNEI
jgi:hypothetical protein